MCPSLALKLTTPAPREASRPAIPQGTGNLKLIASSPSGPELDVTEEWIAEISDVGRQIPRPIS
jgi:hypothetical protein